MTVAADPFPLRRGRSHGRAARAYLAFAVVGFRQECTTIPALLGRATFLAVILFIFSRLWQRVLAEGTIAGFGDKELLWYLAITEWIVLSFPYVHWDIERDLRSGELVTRLPQPVSYLGARVAEASGAAALRLVIVGVAAAGFATLFAGGLPAEPIALLIVVPLGLAGIMLGLLSVTAIGVGAVWLQDPSPLFWIWQKFVFVLGGLFLPLAIYPDLVRQVAEWTPFAAMLNGPARQAFRLDAADAAQVALQLAFWIVLTSCLLLLVWRRAQHSLDAHGG